MKYINFKSAIFLFLAISTLYSCTKNETPTLVAKWNFPSWTYHEVVTNSYDTTVTYTNSANDYIDFRADGKVYSFSNTLFGGYDTSTYVISGTSLTVTDNTNSILNFEIRNLTNSSVSLYNRSSDSTGYSEATLNLTK